MLVKISANTNLGTHIRRLESSSKLLWKPEILHGNWCCSLIFTCFSPYFARSNITHIWLFRMWMTLFDLYLFFLSPNMFLQKSVIQCNTDYIHDILLPSCISQLYVHQDLNMRHKDMNWNIKLNTALHSLQYWLTAGSHYCPDCMMFLVKIIFNFKFLLNLSYSRSIPLA
jgi:hypothetical protein